MAMKMKTKKGGTGRKKRDEMKLIEDSAKRQVAFSKRRPTLFGMAGGLSVLCGVHVTVVVFSLSARGNAFAFGSPSVDAVLRRYHQDGSHDEDDDAAALAVHDDDAGALAALRRELDDTKVRVEADKARMKAVESNVERAMAARSTALWWQADVEARGAAELPEFETALRRLRDTLLHRRVDALQLPIATAPPMNM